MEKLGVIVTFHTILSYALLVTALFTGTLRPYVYQVDHWFNGTQDLYCLNDYHDEIPDSIKQQEDLLELANNGASLIIVEDMAGYEGDNQAIKRYIIPSEQPSEQFLLHITTQAQKKSIPVFNVEFRQSTVGGVEGAHVSAREALESAQAVEQEAYTYNDGEPFDSYYTSVLEQWEIAVNTPMKKWFTPIRMSEQLFCEALLSLPYIQKIDAILEPYQVGSLPESAKKTLVCKLYNSALIDIRLIHALAQGQQYKTIYLCAGSGHIKRINSFLSKAGYTYTNSFVEDGSKKGVDLKEAYQALHTLKVKESVNVMEHNQVSDTLFVWWAIFFASTLGLLSLFLIIRFKRILFALLVALTIGKTLSAYVTEIQVWKKDDQALYCLSDGHYPTPLSINQTNEFIDQVGKEKESSIVIIEDILEYEGNNKEVTRALHAFNQPELHFLPQLTRHCKRSGLEACSIEFRNDHYASRCGAHVTGKEVYKISDRIRSELATYNDGLAFNRCYKKYQQDLALLRVQCDSFVDQFRKTDMLLVDAIPASTYQHGLDEIVYSYTGHTSLSPDYKKEKILQIYDAPLIDVLILHELAKHPDKKQVFICAGAWHIDNLASSFEELGYTKVWSTLGINTIEGQPEYSKAVEVGHAFKTYCTVSSCDEVLPVQTSSISLSILLILCGLIVIGLLIVGRYKFVLIIIITLFTGDIQSHIFKINKWTNEDTSHTLFTMHDFHTSRLPMNHKGNEQRAAIVSLGKEREACIIVEDIYPDAPALFKDPINYDPNVIGPMEDKTPFKDSTTPLLAMTPACSEHGVMFDNIEFGQARYVSDMGHIITPADCVRAVDCIATSIKHYNDTEALNAYYALQLHKYQTMCCQAEPFFDSLRTITNKTTKEVFQEGIIPFSTGVDEALKTFGWSTQRIHTTQSTDKMIALLRYYSVPLTDAKLAHAIYSHKNQNLIVCAGFKHIEAIQELLPAIGYTCVNTLGKDLLEDNLSEPPALDIKESFLFLNPEDSCGYYHGLNFPLIILVGLSLCFGGMLFRSRRRIA